MYQSFNIQENWKSRGSRYLRRQKSSPTAGAIDLTVLPAFPGISAPAAPTLTPNTTGGTLAAATYTYAITAYNVNGETIASATAAATTTGAMGSVSLAWAAVTGAIGYRVYGRIAGSLLLLADAGNVLAWNDTGAPTPQVGVAPPTINTTQVISGAQYGQIRAGDMVYRTASGLLAAMYNPAAQSATMAGVSEDNYPYRLGIDNTTTYGRPPYDPHPVSIAVRTSGEFIFKSTPGDVYSPGLLVYGGIDPQTVTVVATGSAIGRVANDQNPSSPNSGYPGGIPSAYSATITGALGQEIVIELNPPVAV